MVAWKVMTGIILALVLQLTQVAHGVLACQARSTICASAECHCCEGGKACPCAESPDPGQAPLPAVPSVKVDKLDHVLPPQSEPHMVATEWSARVEVPQVLPDCDDPRGFRGVPLTVSFCRFLI